VPGLDPADPGVRAAIVPLNRPKATVPQETAAAAKIASVDAFHLASLVSAGLMLAGAATCWVGLRASTGKAAVGGGRREAPAVAAGG
jgi:hypothetical protein